MRTDQKLNESIRKQSAWSEKTHADAIADPINQSFSGEERNRFYYNQPGKRSPPLPPLPRTVGGEKASRGVRSIANRMGERVGVRGHSAANSLADTEKRNFRDQSMLSGLDSIADGRAFAIGDFNRDGRPDIALCNANAPVLQLFENQIEPQNNFVALKFEGAARNTPKTETTRHSCRDGYGASVKLTLDNGQTLLREFRCGEGFAAQNSDTMIIGIGDAQTVERIQVTWPSGKKQQVGPIASGELQTLTEMDDEKQTPSVPYAIKLPGLGQLKETLEQNEP